MEESDRLIYEKSNTYRLHADIVRWALLGGYAAFFGATITIAQDIGFFLFIVSVLYLFVLAVQNWFYNLFALFVKECECRLAKNQKLRPIEEFAKSVGVTVNPFHPAFFFSMLAVVASSVAFLVKSMELNASDSICLFLIMNLLFYLWFRNWNSWVYLPFIKKHSNLFK